MTKTFYAILPLSNMAEKSLPTETAILKEFQSPENKDLLFFNSKEDAYQYCAIANQPKYLYDKDAETEARKRNELPSYDWDQTPPTQEESDAFYIGFYHSLSEPTVAEPILLSHQAKTSFAILEIELDDIIWLPEHTHYIISQFLHIPNDLTNQKLITLSNTNEKSKKLEQFRIECRKKPRYNILSLKKAYFADKTAEIDFSPPYQKLTLLRDYVLDPQPNKLAILQNLLSAVEVHKLFKLLIEEKNISTEKLLAAKNALFTALLTQPQVGIQANTQLSPEPTPPMSFKWKIAIGCTLGLAAIGYLAINYIQNHYDKNLSTGWKIAIGCTLGLAAIIYLKKHPSKKAPEPEKNIKVKIIQQEFNLSEIQQGLDKFWQRQALRSNKTFGSKSSGEKARSYHIFSDYAKHLQEKQNQPLSVNKKGELRKKVEFKDNNRVTVTGTQQQIWRLCLYATYSKPACSWSHEELDLAIDKSKFESTKIKDTFNPLFRG